MAGPNIEFLVWSLPNQVLILQDFWRLIFGDGVSKDLKQNCRLNHAIASGSRQSKMLVEYYAKKEKTPGRNDVQQAADITLSGGLPVRGTE